MWRKTLTVAALWACTGCGGDDDAGCKNPLAPCGGGGGETVTTGVASVTVSYPGGPIYIGTPTQFQATETMSDGTTRPSTNATWATENADVATVSSSGLVHPLKAGETTVFAGVNPRGSLRVRIYPSFGGGWSGNAVVVNCEGVGVFVAAFCDEDGFQAGDVLIHESKLNQTNDSVAAEVMFGEGLSARTNGSITVDGELQLSTGPVLPAVEGANVELRNWRSRADEPSRMTGTHQIHVTIPGIPGSATVSFRLENVVKSSAPASVSARWSSGLNETLRRASAGMRRR